MKMHESSFVSDVAVIRTIVLPEIGLPLTFRVQTSINPCEHYSSHAILSATLITKFLLSTDRHAYTFSDFILSDRFEHSNRKM